MALRADHDLHSHLLLEGLLTVFGQLAANQGRSRAEQTSQAAHTNAVLTHVPHLCLAAGAGCFRFFLVLSKPKHTVLLTLGVYTFLSKK